MNPLIQSIGEQQTAAFMLVLARVSPLFLFAPLFSSRNVPLRARGVVAVALAAGLSPIALSGREIDLGAMALGQTMAKELLIGMVFAFTISILFAAISTAGSLLDFLTGFAFGATIDPVNGNQSAVLQQVYSLLGVAIFIAINGDAWVIEGLARTYELVPLHELPDIDVLATGVMSTFSTLFVAALEVAAPVLLALVITDAGFGLVSRVVPQMNIFAVGFPVKVTIALLIVGVSLPFFGGWLGGELQLSVETALRTIGAS